MEKDQEVCLLHLNNKKTFSGRVYDYELSKSAIEDFVQRVNDGGVAGEIGPVLPFDEYKHATGAEKIERVLIVQPDKVIATLSSARYDEDGIYAHVTLLEPYVGMEAFFHPALRSICNVKGDLSKPIYQIDEIVTCDFCPIPQE